MSFTGIWEQYNPHILHWLIVRELVQLEIIRFRAVYLTALFFLLNQMLSLRIIAGTVVFVNHGIELFGRILPCFLQRRIRGTPVIF